jgi:hypothetical protein
VSIVSEYQFLAFRAIDRPLTDKELEFARSQSSRAEITPWSMENEYHFGDFHGDAAELLRRGFDVHLHYANFGIRKIMLRLPAGLPGTKSAWSPYVDGDQVSWKNHKRGPGGILTIEPSADAGTFDEQWDPGPGAYFECLQCLRNDLLNGDLRPLYVFWLCGQSGDYGDDPQELIEPPVPAGLAEASEASRYLLGFFGLDELLLDAAGESAARLTKQSNPHEQVDKWVRQLKADDARALLNKILTEKDHTGVRAETLARIRNEANRPVWPTRPGQRTLAALVERTEQLRAEADAKERAHQEAAAKREAKRKERERKKRMTQMVNNPQKWLNQADQLVEARGTANYRAAAEILAEMREAIGGKEGDKITRRHAAHLTKCYPTLNHLKGSLRKRGLVP